METVDGLGLLSTSPLTASPRPGWKMRLAAVAFYLGLGPLLRPLRLDRDPFVRHHAAQALAVVLILLAFLVGGLLSWVALSWLIVYRREWYESLPNIGDMASPLRDGLLLGVIFLAWLLAWVGGVMLALLGSTRALPVIARVARRPRLLRLAFWGNVFLWASGALVAGVALHASSLTRETDDPAPVYLLYDDMGFVPRWVFNLGCYRISRAATARWGSGCVVVAPLDEHHLRLALRHGRFVFLACHGVAGDIVTSDHWIAPFPLLGSGEEGAAPRGVYVASHDADRCNRPWAVVGIGENLEFLYNTACDGGKKAKEWERGLAPAEVQTFDRLSAVAEHIVWLWFRGPERVRRIGAAAPRACHFHPCRGGRLTA